MTPTQIELLLPVAKALRTAGHGEKAMIKQTACERFGISLATLHRRLNAIRVPAKRRKRRADAGRVALPREEALLISGVMMKAMRQNGKRGYALTDVIADLRTDGLLVGGRLDTDTGELVPLSDSAIARALRHYRVHPDQLLRPTPHQMMQSLHPNHVWEIDASICVLYYLTPKAGETNGLRVMEHSKFYKNKPKNVAKITANRVWSYEITDHASGWVYVEYVMGAESGQNLCNVLINAMQERGGADILHGVPDILYMDPGSANTGAMAKNLCKHLGIRAIAHEAGNARATGQVEQARNLIERKFEAGLRFQPVADLDELNAKAAQWRAKFNATAVHTRHGRTRSEVWMAITAEQLVKCPDIATCQALAVEEPVERKIGADLRIKFRGDRYDVSQVPGLMVGEKVLVARAPLRDNAAHLVLTDAEGRERFHLVPQVVFNALGFAEGSAVYGEEHKAFAKSEAEKTLEEIEQVMMGEAPDKSTIPLQGRFNPYKANEEADLPHFLPRRGTEHQLAQSAIESATLGHVDAARALSALMADDWKPDHYQWLQQRYPQGIKEDDLPAIAERLRGGAVTLRGVQGGQA